MKKNFFINKHLDLTYSDLVKARDDFNYLQQHPNLFFLTFCRHFEAFLKSQQNRFHVIDAAKKALLDKYAVKDGDDYKRIMNSKTGLEEYEFNTLEDMEAYVREHIKLMKTKCLLIV